jgi:PAS domain S-box-containing protein
MAEKKVRKGKFDSLRQRAEKLVSQNRADLALLSRQDIESLAHELAVHQIELEVQNEELRQTQARLEDARNRYADLYDFAPAGYLTLDKVNLVIEANITICNMLGIDRVDLLQKRISDYIAPESQEDFYYHVREARRSSPKTVGEFKMLKVNGAAFNAQFESILTGDQALRIAIIDITEQCQAKEALSRARDELETRVQERTEQLQEAYDETMQSQQDLKGANQQLKQYANRITQVQEEERKRIAYELHDDTAQYLSILKMQIGALADSEEIQSPKVKEKLQFLEKDADRAFNDVRRYSHELRPTTLEHQGLVAALEQIADDFNKLGQLTVEVHLEGMEPELSEETKLGFFRVAQEAINNTRKHAKASQVNIDIRFNHKNLMMIVSDNGEGFNAKEALRKSSGKGSLGLLSMRERADLINADLKIESESGKGTKVTIKTKA